MEKNPWVFPGSSFHRLSLYINGTWPLLISLHGQVPSAPEISRDQMPWAKAHRYLPQHCLLRNWKVPTLSNHSTSFPYTNITPVGPDHIEAVTNLYLVVIVILILMKLVHRACLICLEQYVFYAICVHAHSTECHSCFQHAESNLCVSPSFLYA